MKKNYVFRTAMCLGVAVMLTLCGASGTYAKYTGTIQGTADTARVAKFAFSFGESDSSKVTYPTTKTYTVDLFDTVLDSKDGTTETDINTGGAGVVIVAPGSCGYVPIYIKNDGEVTVNATLKSTITNTKNIPIKYGVITGAVVPTKDQMISCNETAATLDDALASVFSNTDITTSGANNKKEGYLMWYWPFDGVDAADTALGEEAFSSTPAEISVKIDCTATQVD